MTTFVLGEPEFGRYTVSAADSAAAVLEAMIDLGNALTTARREQEALELLVPTVEVARHSGTPPDALGWAVLTLATAQQYAGHADSATAGFEEALTIARGIRDEELEHYALHHLGRHLVDTGDLDGAREAFTACLAIRERLGEPRAAQTAAALAALAG